MNNAACKMSERRLAVFDFDGTLIKGDSFISFARFAVGLRAYAVALLRSAKALAKWKLGFIDGGEAKEVLFGNLYRGMPVEKFYMLGEAFSSRIVKQERVRIVSRMREFISLGVPVAILTASVPAWIEPWARKNGVTFVIGTEIEVDVDGRLTGRFSTPNCRGEEKVRRLSSAVSDWKSKEIWAFGDSDGDTALLAVAAHPTRV